MTRLTRCLHRVKFSAIGNARIITLDRPRAMNALSRVMMHDMREQLDQWSNPSDDDLACVIIKATNDKVFCCGGDVKDLMSPDGRQHMFREAYQLYYEIATFNKPYVAMMSGVVMGGGAGVTLHAPIRIGTETTRISMPETRIGHFPDCGIMRTFIRLNQSHPGLGLFLPLTGRAVSGGECKQVGLTTHYVKTERLAEVEMALSDLKPGASVKEIDLCIKQFEEEHTPVSSTESITSQLPQIERHFANKTSVKHIIDDLDKTEWGRPVATELRRMSPTSLAVTFDFYKRTHHVDLKGTFEMEYNLAYSVARRDMPEGVRALVTDRDNAPKWEPGRIEDVTQAYIDTFFDQKPNGWRPGKPADSMFLSTDGTKRLLKE